MCCDFCNNLFLDFFTVRFKSSENEDIIILKKIFEDDMKISFSGLNDEQFINFTKFMGA